MLEEKVTSFFSRRSGSLARNRVFHSFMNSKIAYMLLAWEVSKYVQLLQEPTNENVLAALSKLEKIVCSFLPKNEDRIHESRIIGALKQEFETAVEQGTDSNLTLKAKRTLALMGQKYLKTFLLDFGAVRFALGTLNERFLAREGKPYFHFLGVQPNSDCTAIPRCPGCFGEKSEGKLDYETLDRVMRESIALGSKITGVAGGETLLERENLLKLFRNYKMMPFVVFTNGKLLDESYAEEVADLGNVITLINIPGLERTAVKIRRDLEVWNDISKAAHNLRKYGAASGFSSTVYQSNFRNISSPEFVKQMIDFGMMLGFYFTYGDPVGCSPRQELTLSSEMCDEFSARVHEVSAHQPMILINTVKGETKIGGCPAARNGMVYVQSNGNVAGCWMVPQLDDRLNVKAMPLEKILSSPYFTLIRTERPMCLMEPDFLARLQAGN